MRLVRGARRLGVPTCLVVNEPAVVIPQHAQSRVLRKFDFTIYVGREGTEPQLKWPQTWRPLLRRGSRINRAVVVNADKWSFIRGQNYWLRAAISSHDSRVDVYGPGWSRSVFERSLHRSFDFVRAVFSITMPSLKGLRYALSTPRNYVGIVEDKVEIMSRYKVAIVIENSSELMTEKLFDAWFAGCVPVYVGPLVGQFGIPDDIVVQSEPNAKSLQAAIHVALNTEISEFQDKVEKFLVSKEALAWRAELALEKILAAATRANSAN